VYTVAVKRDFIARHFLIGGDWGPENNLHAHHYQVELQLFGDELDEHGYLVDIVAIERLLNAQVERYRDCTLNDQAEFSVLNPSIEHFSRILCQALSAQIAAPNISALLVRLWENDIAWAGYQIER
jgi:6-pyruvoyltetrahydropterin/6-carboxytetrahydropterin synthase